MGNGQTDIFIEVKKRNRLPIDGGFREQSLEHFELGSPCRHNHVGETLFLENHPQMFRSEGRRGLSV